MYMLAGLHICLCTMCMPEEVRRGNCCTRDWGLQMVMRHHVSVQDQTWVFGRAVSAINC